MKKLLIALCITALFGLGCDGGGTGGCENSSSSSSSSSSSGGTTTFPDNWPLTGNLRVHDPAIIKEGGTYYIFGTDVGILMKRSYDGLAWSNAGRVFTFYPSWANTYVPDHANNIWAPDISYYNGRYYLYYAISSFGSNTSAIGLATTTSLSSANWQDHGMVIHSTSSDNYNCIDPHMVVDQSGQPWLAFGSWWSGIKMIELDSGTMKPKSGATLYSLATRANTATEQPYIVYRNGYYYLFTSIDHCCQGVDSDYKISYGRATTITGPYFDKNGVSLMDGGGTLFDTGTDRWRGPGGQSLLGTEAIAYHAYDANNNGTATLLIKNLYWDADGWPYRGDDPSGGGSSGGTSSGGTSSGGSTTTNGTIQGTYSIIATHSGKALDCWEWGTDNGTNITQYNYWGGDAQVFNITPVDGIWHRITPVIAAGQSLDVSNNSTSAGANIQTWSYWDGQGQQFRFESAGSGKWRIVARNSEMCLSVQNSSTADGANVIQNNCLSGAGNQIFELIKPAGGDRTQADNPLFKNFRSADPSPVVHDGRFYIVVGEDQVNTDTFNMYAWRLLSSADMIHWTDHGVIARPSDFSWMPANCAWASCIIYRNGYFYFYASNDFTIGVLRSRNITGPYTDVLGRALIDQNTPNNTPDPNARDIDPMCFIDDDGQAYLFWGGDGICRYARLTNDMAHLASGVMDVPGLTGNGYTYLEAPFIIKTNGTYFLMYADQPWPSEIRYATSNSIHGPWSHRGVIGTPSGTGTNHEGAAYFNGQWWYTYHTEELSNGNPFSRSVCVDRMTISGNTIQRVNYTSFD